MEVTSVDLYDKFYITMANILLNINNKENKSKIFEKSASSKAKFIIYMIIATYCLITIPPVLEYGASNLLIALFFPGVGFTLMFKMLLDPKIRNSLSNKLSSISVILFFIIWGLGFGGLPWATLVLPALQQDSIYLIGYIVGIVCVLGMVVCLTYLPRRTAYGNEILGKIEGFKNFLETAEKEQLEAMVTKNPTYFYNILPYTYVLGVSDKWIKKFEVISMQAPTWYDSPDAFDIATFGTFLNSTMSSATSVMSYDSSSSSSGSGGGSAGGGSGGGGGGSW